MFSIVHKVGLGEVRKGVLVSDVVGRPAYKQVADDLRRQIAVGELAVGAAIPSTARLTGSYGVSSTVVRAAVAQLRADGLLVGQPGKGVYVCATPDAVAERAVSVEELAVRVSELCDLYEIERARREKLEAEVARLGREAEAIRGRLDGPARG
jgi:GntR family transcriptional regulator